jgi:hypothetical protein
LSGNSSGRSLKDGNRVHIALIAVMNSLLLYTIVQTGAISIAGFKALLTEWTNLLPVGLAVTAATVANGLLSANMKARLVFLRWRHALPGHRAFSKYAASDPRIDIDELKTACGNTFPDDPVDQNNTWYRLYKSIEKRSSVLQAQRDFLLMRDYAGLAALFVIVFGSAAFVEVPSWRVFATYSLFLAGQFLVVRHAAFTYGVRFVTTVLAEKAAVSGSAVGTVHAGKPRRHPDRNSLLPASEERRT